MEKQFKPVPDVECLKYHGTPEKPDIKIFVSHRIDQDSVTVDNPLYIPVRCGAVYDEREDVTILGDDTGDNISDKRKTFCELTVLYWAWKNVEADYYGLCHYRRYLSFSNKQYEIKKYVYSWGCVHEDYLTDKAIKKYGLQQDVMSDEITDYDIIIPTPCKLDETDGPWKNNREYIEAHINSFNADDIDLIRTILAERSPKFVKYYDEYITCGYANWYNSFIIKKEIFNEFCSWMFPILFEFEKRYRDKKYSRNMCREPGFFGEHLWGTYLRYIKDQLHLRIGEKQLVFFKQTDAQSIGKQREENTIPIILCCSEPYAPYASVTIESIIDTASDSYLYKIILLENGLSEVTKRQFTAMVKDTKNIELIFYNPYSLLSEAKFHVVPRGTKESYYKLFVPWILTEYDKAIILDCDTIANTDLSELYNQDLSNNWIAAAKDPVLQGQVQVAKDDVRDYYTNVLNIDSDEIINSGVLLMNLSKIRKDVSLDCLLSFCQKTEYVNQEQDVFNSFMKGHIKYLDQKWNFIPKSSFQMHFDMLCGPLPLVEEYEAAAKDIKIIHYSGDLKPWFIPHVEYGYLFWETAKKTLYYEVILQRMVSFQITYGARNPSQIQPYVSGARKVADVFFPKGSRRRDVLKVILPKDSKQWNFLKSIYYWRKKKDVIIG